MNFNAEEAIRRIATNIAIIEKSLATAYTTLSFNYLLYFLNKAEY